MNSHRAHRAVIIGLGFVTILLALVPILQTLVKGDFRGVLPAYVDDDIYYYGRIKEVIDGRPLIGNPYFLEYRDAGAASFFVTDWLATIPAVLGASFPAAMTINLAVWSLIFSILVFFLCRTLRAPPILSAAVALLAYSEVYWVILRPVVMQQVFPFFLLFILALVAWLREPQKKKSIFLLALSWALSFYLYMFLWQIILGTLLCVAFHALLRRAWHELRSLAMVVAGTGILALPILFYSLYQATLPFYWETVRRVGLVATHAISVDAYYYGRWVVLILFLFFLVRRWIPQSVGEDSERHFIGEIAGYTGLGMLGVALNNLITGQYIATASHVGRFVTLWVALFFPLLLWQVFSLRDRISQISRLRIGIFVLVALFCGGFLVANLKRSLPFQRIADADVLRIQPYANPLGWIDAREEDPVVIWADDALSYYVPILTKHYVLWNHLGGLHVMPTKEVEDRYLISRIGMLSPEQLSLDFGLFEGPKSEILRTDDKIASLLHRQKELKKNISDVMKTYHVSYLIANREKQQDDYFRALPGAREVWKDNLFIIYEIR